MKRIVFGLMVVGAVVFALSSCVQPGSTQDTSNLIDPSGLYVQTNDDWNAGGAVWSGKSDGLLYTRMQMTNWDNGADYPSVEAIKSLDPNDTRGAFLQVSRQYGDGFFNFILLGSDNNFATGDTVKVTFDIKADLPAADQSWLQVFTNCGGDWNADTAYYGERMDYGVYGDGNMHAELVQAQDATGTNEVDGSGNPTYRATWMFKWDSWGTAPVQEVAGTTNGEYLATAYYDGTTTSGWKTISIIIPPTFVGYIDNDSSGTYTAGDTLDPTNNAAISLGFNFASLTKNLKYFYLDNLKVTKVTTGSYTKITAVQ